jgi:hypothetical protein
MLVGGSFQESDHGPDEQKSHKTKGIHNWTQTGKGTYVRVLCQKNEGSLKLNRDQLRWVVELFTGYCYLKGHLFKLGLTDDFTCERWTEEGESATHVLCDLAHLRFRHLAQFFMEPSDYYKVVQSLQTRLCRILAFLPKYHAVKTHRSVAIKGHTFYISPGPGWMLAVSFMFWPLCLRGKSFRYRGT